MARKQRLIQYGSLILLAFLIFAGGFYFMARYAGGGLDPLEAIPENSGAFIRINQPGKLVRSLSGENQIWQELAGTVKPGEMLLAFSEADSLLNVLGYAEILDEGVIYLSFSEDSAGMAFAVIFRWPYGASKNDLELIIGVMSDRKLQKSEMRFHDVSGYRLFDEAGSCCYYAIDHGLCMIGNTPAVLEACARRIDDRSALPFANVFEKVASTAGRNVDANIFINFLQIPVLSKQIFASSYLNNRVILPDFGSWSEIDLLIKNDEILLNGYTETVDTLDLFLNLFQQQEPQKIEIVRILPYNTSMLFTLGFSDYQKLYAENVEYMDNAGVFPERTSKLEDLRNRFGPNLEEHLTSWIGNEIALAVINPHLNDNRNNTFLAVHAADVERAVSKLGAISTGRYSYDFRDYPIRRIVIPELVPVMLGNMFSAIEENYYTRIEDYIVFANSGKSLENFINIFLSGKTLKQNENFKGFTDNVSDRSNLFCYFNIRNSTNVLEEVLTLPLSNFISENPEVISNFEALAIQFKALNNMYFTSAYLRHNKAYVSEDLSIWKVYLDAPVHGQPYFVKDHRTNNLRIVTFDALNNMYLIDHDGNIEWKLNIGEKVISDVHTVDYYKNGKIQYLFNTETRIYLIDLLGRDVEGYPLDLRDKATNGLAVIDYDSDRDYRILIACDDNRVYNFNIQGRKVDGWKNPLSKGRVIKPVQHLRQGGKDYIVIADAEGNLRITDRRGSDRINLKSTLVNAQHSNCYVNETNSKGIILTTDANGKLCYIRDDGRMETTDFGHFSSDHYFLYEDFDNGGGKDFIFLDGNKLTVFDRFKNVMFSHEFENEIMSSPVIIPVSSKEKLIGIVSEASGKIYLFDREGKLLSTPDHIGKTRMLIGSLNRDGQLNMITGSGNTIYNYYFR